MTGNLAKSIRDATPREIPDDVASPSAWHLKQRTQPPAIKR
jgi:hypothetical protein